MITVNSPDIRPKVSNLDIPAEVDEPPVIPKACLLREDDNEAIEPATKVRIDLDGDGCADYCRVLQNGRRMKCEWGYHEGQDSSSYVSLTLDAGYEPWQWWVDLKNDKTYSFCVVVGTLDSSDWLKPPGAVFMNCAPIRRRGLGNFTRLRGHVTENIDRGYPGGNWQDVNGDGFPDYCRDVGFAHAKVRKCLLSNGKAFTGEQ